ncbi:MAG: outer membrane beta-barrel protein [Candidatus Thorarchaeota archaeon]
MFILLLTIPQGSLFASDFSINFGINHSWLINPDVPKSWDNEFNPGFSICVNLSQILVNDIDFSYGIRLFSVGNYSEDKLSNLETYGTTTKSKINYIYISSPFQLDYELFQNVAPFLNIEPSFLVKSEMSIKNDFVDNKSDISKDMESLNLFIGIGLKYIFDFNNHKFALVGMYNYGLLRITKNKGLKENQIGTWTDLRVREFLLTIGYYF